MCQTYDEALTYADSLSETVGCKKAAIVVVFFIYVAYALITGIIYAMEWKKKDEKLINALKAFKLDIEQRSFFFLAFALLVQILTPNPFSVIMLFFYLFTFPLLFVGHFRPDKWKLRVIGICIQILLVLIILFELLIDPWCRHYYYRYTVGVPGDSQVSNSTQKSNTQTPTNAGNNTDNIAGTNSTNAGLRTLNDYLF